MEQNVRDARIGTLYEGTTGIQALDLLGRKILLQGGRNFQVWSKEVAAYCFKQVWVIYCFGVKFLSQRLKHLFINHRLLSQLWENRSTSEHKAEAFRVLRHLGNWWYMTGRIGLKARKDQEVVSCAAVNYLMFRLVVGEVELLGNMY